MPAGKEGYMPEKIKIGVISLGCSKNRIDTEYMLARLSDAEKYEFVDSLEKADVAIINTCAFTNEAREESLNMIMEAEQLKRFSNLKGIVVAGCMSERYKNEFAYSVPRVDSFLGIVGYRDIETAVEKALRGEKYFQFGDIRLPDEGPERLVTTVKPTAYVRIAEGCNNRCSYCVIPQIRGPYQSRRKEDVLGEIKKLAADGYSEIILISQDSTKYGKDLYGKECLPELMDEAAQIAGVKWLRVLYCNPESITEELLHVMKKHDNIPDYIDMPVQHMDTDILKAMNRRSTFESITQTMEMIRNVAPDFIIRSTIIVGFPGETRDCAKRNVARVKDAQFDRLGVFTYSREENTPAAQMDEQVEEEEKEFRKDSMMTVQSQISLERNKARIGTECDVLVEGRSEQTGLYYGRSFAELPEVDGKIFIQTDKRLVPGRFYKVRIDKAFNYDLMGALVS